METMKGTFKKKLKSKAGETIAETLIALLIAALALTMLAGSVSYAFDMIQQSRRSLKTYYESADNMATFALGTDSGTVTVSSDSFTDDYDVIVAQNNAFKRIKVVAYKKA